MAEGTDSTTPRQTLPTSPEPASPALKVGDIVVYPAHGIGRVVAIEQRDVGGTERDCAVVDLPAGLRVTLSLDEAAARLRAVADRAELESVGRTLASRSPRREGSWTRRIKENKTKLTVGRPGDLAEIVRDGARYEQSAGAHLSHHERRLYLQARALLVGEICSAREVAAGEADAWIDARLASPDRNEE